MSERIDIGAICLGNEADDWMNGFYQHVWGGALRLPALTK